MAPRWGAKTAHAITAATGAVGGPKGRLAELCSAYGRLCLPDGAVAAAIACAAAADFLIYKQFYKHLI